MTLTGFGRFDLAFFRHTGCWFTLAYNLTAAACFRGSKGMRCSGRLLERHGQLTLAASRTGRVRRPAGTHG